MKSGCEVKFKRSHFALKNIISAVLNRQTRIIDQEMQGIGGQKLDMPSLCSAELWKTSERWDLMGKELLRLKDRHGGDYCLAPTHEEAVTTLVAHQMNVSYKQLPLLLYQVAFTVYRLYLLCCNKL